VRYAGDSILSRRACRQVDPERFVLGLSCPDKRNGSQFVSNQVMAGVSRPKKTWGGARSKKENCSACVAPASCGDYDVCKPSFSMRPRAGCGQHFHAPVLSDVRFIKSLRRVRRRRQHRGKVGRWVLLAEGMDALHDSTKDPSAPP